MESNSSISPGLLSSDCSLAVIVMCTSGVVAQKCLLPLYFVLTQIILVHPFIEVVSSFQVHTCSVFLSEVKYIANLGIDSFSLTLNFI